MALGALGRDRFRKQLLKVSGMRLVAGRAIAVGRRLVFGFGFGNLLLQVVVAFPT